MGSNKGILREYPRPDFVRKDWINLNGKWGFAFDDTAIGEDDKWYSAHDFEFDILVPYCYQSKLSGIEETTFHSVVWYKKEISIDASFLDQRVLLNFGAVDFETRVWVNGAFIGQHVGGNTRFQFDVSRLLKPGDNSIVLRVEDKADTVQPRGKQGWKGKPFGCWYTPTTGIWQSVWLEKVGSSYLDTVLITPDIDKKTARMELSINHYRSGITIMAKISLQGEHFKTLEISTSNRYPVITIDFDGPDELYPEYLWHPDSPNLFDVTISLMDKGAVIDQVGTYFGMRKISTREGYILINNIPYFQKLILDQGYWDESLMTPPSDNALKEDIEKAIAMGFNGARKHQKMEDPRFYYWADKLGFLVWGELPSNYSFSRKGIDLLTKEWKDFIIASYNHPSIVTWVPANESWGVWNVQVDKQKQDFCNALYFLTKSLDQTRLVSGNDGWEQSETDICAIHDYVARGEDFLKKTADKEKYLRTLSDWRFTYAEGYHHKGQPVLLTEYGGIAFNDNPKEGWGYQEKVNSGEEFLERFKSMTEAIVETGYFYGLCYTQLTDVEQEVNGLLYPDRSYKVAPEKIKGILDGLKSR